jgi:hypothetical protein
MAQRRVRFSEPGTSEEEWLSWKQFLRSHTSIENSCLADVNAVDRRSPNKTPILRVRNCIQCWVSSRIAVVIYFSHSSAVTSGYKRRGVKLKCGVFNPGRGDNGVSQHHSQ